jgi:hypothetical protein
MIYAYRLKDRDSKETGRVVEGFTVRHTWQFTSDPKAASLKKWGKVSVLEAKDITTLKQDVDAFDKGQKDVPAEARPEAEVSVPQNTAFDNSAQDSGDPLVKDLEGKSLAELKDFARIHGFDEAEYSKLTRSKLVEYIVLGMRNKENA